MYSVPDWLLNNDPKAPKKGRTNKEGQSWVLLSRKGYAASEISSRQAMGPVMESGSGIID